MKEIAQSSDLLTLTDYDSEEFIDRIRGAFQLCCRRAQKAVNLQTQVDRRISGLRRHTFDGLAEIGEAFLRVQEARPGEFETWFAMHEEQLEMCLRTAEACKAQARNVREHGAEVAFLLSLDRKPSAKPILAVSFRQTKAISDMSDEERLEVRKRIAPIVQLDVELAALGVASPS